MKKKDKNGKILLEGVIYKYTNKINGKVYIGQTTNEKRRIDDHKNNNKKYNDHFHNAIKKYGWDSFEYKVLFRVYCTNDQDLKNTLDIKETIAIKYFNSTNRDIGYNLKSGGSRGKPTKEVIEKQRSKMIGKFVGEKNPFYGKHHTKESKIKMSLSKVGKFRGENNPLFGRKYSKEQVERVRPNIEKMRLSNIKSVVQLDLNGNFVKEWDSIVDAERFFGMTHSSISQCCIGYKGRLQCHGFMWMFKEDYEEKISKGEIKEYINPVKIPIVQLSLEGDFIQCWDSIADAGNNLGINKSCISQCCIGIGRIKSVGGFMWMYKAEYDSGKLPRKKIDIRKRIIQLDFNGTFIRCWDSITEAEKNLNIILQKSVFVQNNKGNKSCGGFMWMYEDDYNIYKDNIKPYKRINHNSIKIIQLTENYEFIKSWNSIRDASIELKITQNTISSCIKNNTPHRIKRFRFMYKEDYDKLINNSTRDEI